MVDRVISLEMWPVTKMANTGSRMYGMKKELGKAYRNSLAGLVARTKQIKIFSANTKFAVSRHPEELLS